MSHSQRDGDHHPGMAQDIRHIPEECMDKHIATGGRDTHKTEVAE